MVLLENMDKRNPVGRNARVLENFGDRLSEVHISDGKSTSRHNPMKTKSKSRWK